MLQNNELSDTIYALNFSFWKKSSVRQCFPGKQIIFIKNPSKVPVGGILAVWGMPSLADNLTKNFKLLRLEDGFLRSVGLGADLIRPLSWVVDSRGLYYDATKPSDLEYLLNHSSFTPALLERAACLRKRIVEEKLTKYNIGGSSWQRPNTNKKIILVPGQVESDASIRYGAPAIRSNMQLLQTVRQNHPAAYLIYKPHPDVLAGLRARGIKEDEAFRFCDELVTDVDMSSLLPLIDEVHVITSLAGFEALLYGKAVTCYGQPFYSSWGLTTDIIPNPRRGRLLSMEELVAGALIEYPLYMSRVKDSLISVEEALEELLLWKSTCSETVPWWRKTFRMILRLVVGIK